MRKVTIHFPWGVNNTVYRSDGKIVGGADSTLFGFDAKTRNIEIDLDDPLLPPLEDLLRHGCKIVPTLNH